MVFHSAGGLYRSDFALLVLGCFASLQSLAIGACLGAGPWTLTRWEQAHR